MNICVFCGSSFGAKDQYKEAAAMLGTAIAKRGYGLVYGGASIGLMGAVADAALAAGGRVYGVIPRALADVEISHQGLTELYITADMHTRKAKMAELSEAFAVLPGGIGTLEEAFEIWTWAQLGIHNKPIGLLNVDGFYSGLETFLDHITAQAFVKPAHRGLMLSAPTAENLLDKLETAKVPDTEKPDNPVKP